MGNVQEHNNCNDFQLRRHFPFTAIGAPLAAEILQSILPTIGTSFIDWAQQSRFHLKTEKESASETFCVLNKNRTMGNVQEHNNYNDNLVSMLFLSCYTFVSVIVSKIHEFLIAQIIYNSPVLQPFMDTSESGKSFDAVTVLRREWPRNLHSIEKSRDFSLLHSVQTSSGAHPASYPKSIRVSINRVKAAGILYHIHLRPTLRMRGTIPPLPHPF
jgi:hypothetical protein